MTLLNRKEIFIGAFDRLQEHHGRLVFVCGTEFPVIEKVDTAPFSIKNVECRMIRQKITKTITVYE